MAEHGPELLLLGSQGQVTSAAETAEMFRDIPGSRAGPANSASPIINATYAPNIVVNGSGPESTPFDVSWRSSGRISKRM